MSEKKSVNYWDYLKLPTLLNLQTGNHDSPDTVSVDELHFIIVHQVFELWFKLVLAELRLARDKMAAHYVQEDTVPFVVHHLRRVIEIFRVASGHWKVVETLATQDFLEFRQGLGTASGFQSYQMRELETVLGLELSERIKYGHSDPLDVLLKASDTSSNGAFIRTRLETVRTELNFRKALHNWLHRTPIHGSLPDDPNDPKIVDTFIHEYIQIQRHSAEQQLNVLLRDQGPDKEPFLRSKFDAGIASSETFLYAKDYPEDSTERARNKRIRAAVLFIESYRSLPLLAWPRLLLDTVAELEEQLVLFRTYHARMVERVIGRRVGTGGSSGVDYLDSTTKYRIFEELWVVRTLLLPVSMLPVLKMPSVYGFAADLK